MYQSVSGNCSGSLKARLRYINRVALLIVDEVGYLPIEPGGANLFFQLVNARYEKGATVLTSNRGFKDWGTIFGDNVVAAALLDRLLHHAIVVEIEGHSYRLREHANLVPDTLKGHPRANHGETQTQTRSTTATRSREQRLMHHLFYPQVGNFTLALLGSFNLVLTAGTSASSITVSIPLPGLLIHGQPAPFYLQGVLPQRRMMGRNGLPTGPGRALPMCPMYAWIGFLP